MEIEWPKEKLNRYLLSPAIACKTASVLPGTLADSFCRISADRLFPPVPVEEQIDKVRVFHTRDLQLAFYRQPTSTMVESNALPALAGLGMQHFLNDLWSFLLWWRVFFVSSLNEDSEHGKRYWL